MDNYPNNSDAYRKTKIPAGATNPPEKEVEDIPEKAIVGEVHVRKKSFGEKTKGLLFKEDAKSVWRYVFGDILIPALKNTIVDMGRNGLEMLVLGNARGPKSYDRRDNRSGRIRYDSYYDRDYDPDYRGRYSSYTPTTPTYSYDEITFESRADAENVLLKLKERIYESGAVSVAYLYHLVRWKSDYTADGYGWRDLRDAQVVLSRDGYWLRMPRPVVI